MLASFRCCSVTCDLLWSLQPSDPDVFKEWPSNAIRFRVRHPWGSFNSILVAAPLQLKEVLNLLLLFMLGGCSLTV